MDWLNISLLWLADNYVWIFSLLIQGFIAYHVFFLSKRLTNKARLEHKEKIKQEAEKLLSEIHIRNLNKEVHLININRYFKDYPSNKEKRFEGYSYIRVEIKSTRFDGVEFFESMPVQIYQKPNGRLTTNGKEDEEAFLAFPVGVVPYEWIEHVDISGDEYGWVPQFFCRFKGRTNWRFWRRLLFFGFPFNKLVYYKKSEFYNKNNDPCDMEFVPITDPIYKN